MSLKGRLGSGIGRFAGSRAGSATVIGGAAMLGFAGEESANNDSMRMIMNSVIGTPEDGPGADEILMGRKLDLGDFINPLEGILPNLQDVPGLNAVTGAIPDFGPGWRNVRYAMQPGPGIGNPAIGDMRGAINKRNAFLQESFDKQLSEGMSNTVTDTFNGRKPFSNLNASGDMVMGMHRSRMGGGG